MKEKTGRGKDKLDVHELKALKKLKAVPINFGWET